MNMLRLEVRRPALPPLDEQKKTCKASLVNLENKSRLERRRSDLLVLNRRRLVRKPALQCTSSEQEET